MKADVCVLVGLPERTGVFEPGRGTIREDCDLMLSLKARSEHVNQAKVELKALGKVSRSSLKIGIEEYGEIALRSCSIGVHQTRADPEHPRPRLGTV